LAPVQQFAGLWEKRFLGGQQAPKFGCGTGGYDFDGSHQNDFKAPG
jgi:hypothetical protein